MDVAVKLCCFLLLHFYSVSSEEVEEIEDFEEIPLIYELPDLQELHTTKVFMMPIGPWFFNWTDPVDSEDPDQFSYRLSLHGEPDLPSWMHYTFSERLCRGFLYGAPPPQQEYLEIEVIGLNKADYDARVRLIQMNVIEKSDPALYEVCLKVDKLNVEDMLDSDRFNRLLEVFQNTLWPDSQRDLYITYLAPAAQLGDRLPISPKEGEGIVLHLGSRAPFSLRLLELEKEVMPLRAKGQTNCPDFKHTSVERFFKQYNFSLDWCAFQLIENKTEKNTTPFQAPELVTPGYQKKCPFLSSKQELPTRHYLLELALEMIIPVIFKVMLTILLIFILCFKENTQDGTSGAVVGSIMVIFQNVLRKRDNTTPLPELVQFAAVQRASNNLRSLSNQRITDEDRMSLEKPDVQQNPPPYTGVHVITPDDYMDDVDDEEENESKTWYC